MPKKNSSPFSARKRLIVVAISACFSTAPAWANPTGAQVVNGSASIAQTANLLTVTNSNGAIINWNTFSIGASLPLIPFVFGYQSSMSYRLCSN